MFTYLLTISLDPGHINEKRNRVQLRK